MIAFLIVLFSLLEPPVLEENRVGYHFVEGKAVTVIKFTRYKNLIVIPAQLNDTLKLNLILDTGIRNLILFSKKSTALKNLSTGKKMKVGGRGQLESIECDVSFPNEIKLGDIVGRGIGAVVVNNSDLIKAAPGVDGIIGYELFVRFCIRIDYEANLITLFNEVPTDALESFNSIDLTLNDQRPEILVTLRLPKKKTMSVKALIDTGSSFGFLVYDSNADKFDLAEGIEETKIGTGLAGTVMGYPIGVLPFQVGSDRYFASDSKVVLTKLKKANTPTASIGGGFLKSFIVMFDYPHSRFYIKDRSKG